MAEQQPPTPARASESLTHVLRLSAFATEDGGGNPAGVLLDASGLQGEEMQRIAAEIGYAETAFVLDPAVAADGRRVRIRYFSPLTEVPFCGHATIASAVALAEHRGVGSFTFETPVGPVVIETVRGTGDPGRPGVTEIPADLITASFTSVEPAVRELDPVVAGRLLSLIGLDRSDLDGRWPLREAYAGNRHPIVAVREQAVFDTFRFEPSAMRTLMIDEGWAGTVTVVCRQDADALGCIVVEARNLFPVGDITEDPATGSAAAALGAYLRAIGAVEPPARVMVRQGRHVGRPSLLLVDVPSVGGITVAGIATPID